MISAFRTGEIAGSDAARGPLALLPGQIRQVAIAALTERIRLGVAHCYPEEEFIRGFIAGYNNPQPIIDGLQMFVNQSR